MKKRWDLEPLQRIKAVMTPHAGYSTLEIIDDDEGPYVHYGQYDFMVRAAQKMTEDLVKKEYDALFKLDQQKQVIENLNTLCGMLTDTVKTLKGNIKDLEES